MARFRKRPVVVEAMLWYGPGSANELVRFLDGDAAGPTTLRRDGENLLISTLEGTMRCPPGNWLIRGVNGELYPCDPDVFSKTYEPVHDASEE